jgi:hypothetical protein
LEEAKRVLKPGGCVVFSFLEFSEVGHWQVFLGTLADSKAGGAHPLNVFINRNDILVWAAHLGLELVDVRNAGDVIVPQGALGQSICILKKPIG